MSGIIANAITTCPLLSLSVQREGADEIFRRFVRYDGSRAGAGDVPVGVCRERSTTDEQLVVVDAAGIVLVATGGAVAVGDELAPDAQGRAVTALRPALHLDRVAGANANTDINVAGITVGDEVLDAYLDNGAALARPAVHSDGNVRTATATTGRTLFILWRSAPRPAAARALAAATSADQTIPALLGVDGRAY